MPRNIEIKARIPSIEALLPRACALAGTEPQLIEQDDCFFAVAHGRLKLRLFADGSGELIHYHRPDIAAAKASDYVRVPAPDPAALRELFLLTAKPFVYVVNVDEAELGDAAFIQRMKDLVAPAEAVFLDAKLEAELSELDDEEALELLQSVGQGEPGLNALARVGFDTLGLQTYLTAGPKEARAWTIPKGATAPEAAGVIHTDFQKGFIKAEIVSFDDLVAAGSMAEAKAKGKVRIEGKDYVMQDGDVVEFRFNV